MRERRLPAARAYAGAFWKTWPAQITAKWPEIQIETAEQFVVDVRDQFGFRVHGDARFRALVPEPHSGPAGRRPRASVGGCDGMRVAVRQIRSFLRAHRPA